VAVGVGTIAAACAAPPTTSTVLTSSTAMNVSVATGSVTFTATVKPTLGNAVPTGKVDFTDNGAALGTVDLAGGTASFTAPALPVGSDAIKAAYEGSSTFQPSFGAVTQSVYTTGSTTGLEGGPFTAGVGQNVTFSANVSAGGGVPVGAVTFNDGATTLGPPVPLDAMGFASLSTMTLAVGPHQVTATYGGSTNFSSAPSTSNTVTVTVSAQPPPMPN
jgi:hypothetical protein